MTNLAEAGLEDVRGEALRAHVPDPLAYQSREFTAEYGVRLDDDAMVIHLYPGKEGWDPAYRMDRRLEIALQKCFARVPYTADFTPELDSFAVILFGFGRAPDPWPAVESFFRAIEEAEI